MNWSKSKLAIFIAAIVTIATVAFAADNVIINPSINEDTVVKINDGGVIKEAIRVDASDDKVLLTNPQARAYSFYASPITSDYTLASGVTWFQPEMDINTGVTVTVDGDIYLLSSVTGDGTLVGTGTVYTK